MKIPIKVEEHVTWKSLLFLLASFAAFILIALNMAIARAETVGQVTRTETKEAVASLSKKVEVNKAEADAGNQEVRKDIQAVYNFLLTRQRQERLEKPK